MSKKCKVKKASRSAKTVIRNAMKACEKRKISIINHDWGVDMNDKKGYFVADENKEVCAMGALLVHKNGSVRYDAFRGKRPLSEIEANETAAFILDVDKEWVECFIAGFDGNCPPNKLTLWERREVDGSFFFPTTKDPQIKEYRRAYRIGKELKEEFQL